MARKSILKNYGLLIFWVLFLIAVAVFVVLNKERIYYAIQNGSKTSSPPSIYVPAIVQPVPKEQTQQTQEPAQEPEHEIVETVEAQPLEIVSTPVPAPISAERERIIYFTHVDNTGAISQIQTQRLIPASDTPLFDVLNVMFQGPTTAELKQELISLIPENTKVLSVQVRNGTAYINISEELQYNQFGKEGYDACLKQIIWTATEFPTVQNVQIFIEGERVAYLSESIWIGSPLGREDF